MPSTTEPKDKAERNGRFYIYRNLKTGGFSVRFRGKVTDRIKSDQVVVLKDVKPVVVQSGAARCLREKQRNVHAFLSCESYRELHPLGFVTTILCSLADSFKQTQVLEKEKIQVEQRPFSDDDFWQIWASKNLQRYSVRYEPPHISSKGWYYIERKMYHPPQGGLEYIETEKPFIGASFAYLHSGKSVEVFPFHLLEAKAT